MRVKICKKIKAEERMIAIIKISKEACLILYIRSFLCDQPIHIFLEICELPGQDAQSICNCIVDTLDRYSFGKNNLVKI